MLYLLDIIIVLIDKLVLEEDDIVRFVGGLTLLAEHVLAVVTGKDYLLILVLLAILYLRCGRMLAIYHDFNNKYSLIILI